MFTRITYALALFDFKMCITIFIILATRLQKGADLPSSISEASRVIFHIPSSISILNVATSVCRSRGQQLMNKATLKNNSVSCRPAG